MAKNKSKAKAKEKGSKKGSKKSAEKAAPKKTDDGPKYTVTDLAKELGVQEASARVQLRNKKVAKAGKSYGWNTDKEFKSVVKELKGTGKASKATESDDEDEDDDDEDED